MEIQGFQIFLKQGWSVNFVLNWKNTALKKMQWSTLMKVYKILIAFKKERDSKLAALISRIQICNDIGAENIGSQLFKRSLWSFLVFQIGWPTTFPIFFLEWIRGAHSFAHCVTSILNTSLRTCLWHSVPGSRKWMVNKNHETPSMDFYTQLVNLINWKK